MESKSLVETVVISVSSGSRLGLQEVIEEIGFTVRLSESEKRGRINFILGGGHGSINQPNQSLVEIRNIKHAAEFIDIDGSRAFNSESSVQSERVESGSEGLELPLSSSSIDGADFSGGHGGGEHSFFNSSDEIFLVDSSFVRERDRELREIVVQVGDLYELDIINGGLRVLSSALDNIGKSKAIFSVNNLLNSSGGSDMEGAVHLSGGEHGLRCANLPGEVGFSPEEIIGEVEFGFLIPSVKCLNQEGDGVGVDSLNDALKPGRGESEFNSALVKQVFTTGIGFFKWLDK